VGRRSAGEPTRLTPFAEANSPTGIQKDISITWRFLVLFTHPSLDRSEVNHPLMLATTGVEGVTLADLYAKYPDF
jgi:hypothetical protein